LLLKLSTLTKFTIIMYHTIIIGGGTMGAATAYHLAQRGIKTLVLEQFDLIHERGAHAGQSRIIRKAYFEHPDYVPLLLRAYDNWATLEQQIYEKVYHETGIIYFGPKGDTLLENTKASAHTYQLKLDILDIAYAKKQYPMFDTIPNDWDCLFEPEAGFLMVEKCLQGFISQAMKSTVTFQAQEKVISWKSTDYGVEVSTNKGQYQAEKLIVTAGAWTNQILETLQISLKITRQILGWVQPKINEEAFKLGIFPCWFVSDPNEGLYYGMPIVPNSVPMGLKLGAHHHGKIVKPDVVDRNISAEDEADFRIALEKYMPNANGQTLAIKTCLYANTPDEHFIIDQLPDNERIILACGFSGHGFKFASVIGEALADLAENNKTQLPIDFLRLKRFM
jgi:sarcosine oxidase